MFEFDQAIFAKRLKELREEEKLTQAKLAKKLNIEASAISHYENADYMPSMTTLCNMALLFKVSLDYIVGLTDDM